MRALGWLDVGGGASAEEVRQLAEDFKCRFPADVVSFLCSHAGASNPDECEFDVLEPSGRRRVGSFGAVLLVSRGGVDSVRATAQAVEGLPPTLIPIIGTGSGDYVCLDVDGGSARAVVYYMHERPLADCIVPLAASLSEFLDKLRAPDD